MKPEALAKSVVRSVVYSQLAYWSSLACAALSVIYIPPGSIRSFVILTPLLTAILCACVAYWLYAACDEYLRARILRSVTITALVVAMGSLAYFCMELLGFPRLSIVWVSIVGWSTFNLQLLFVIVGAPGSEDAEPLNFPASR